MIGCCQLVLSGYSHSETQTRIARECAASVGQKIEDISAETAGTKASAAYTNANFSTFQEKKRAAHDTRLVSFFDGTSFHEN
jgi:hypothetical protein